jgi:hypothetical protein
MNYCRVAHITEVARHLYHKAICKCKDLQNSFWPCNRYTKNFGRQFFLKQKIIIFGKMLPDREFIFLPLATSMCDTTKINQFFKYSKRTNKFFCYTQCTACDNGYKFAQHQYFTLKKIVQKFRMLLTLTATNVESFIKSSCFDFLA